MESDRKAVSPQAVPRTLAKAERYRLLNEPGEAESICLDVLEIEPANQEALVMLLLALTDQFHEDPSRIAEATATAARLGDDYERAYYTGIGYERPARAQLPQGTPRARSQIHPWPGAAMN